MEFLEFSSDALFPSINSDLLQQQIALLENERTEEVGNVEQPVDSIRLDSVSHLKFFLKS